MARALKPEAPEDGVSVAIDQKDLHGELSRVPSDLDWWNGQAAQADQQLREAELDLETWEATRRLQVVTDFRSKFGVVARPPGEEKIDAIVYADPGYRRAREKVIGAARAKANAVGRVDAIRTKRDMLVSLCSLVRTEMEREAYIKRRV